MSIVRRRQLNRAVHSQHSYPPPRTPIHSYSYCFDAYCPIAGGRRPREGDARTRAAMEDLHPPGRGWRDGVFEVPAQPGCEVGVGSHGHDREAGGGSRVAGGRRERRVRVPWS